MRLARSEEGSSLIIVVFVSFLLLSMVTLVLRHGESAETSSARGRNFDLSLASAEAGVDEAMARIESSDGTFTGSLSGSTPQGTYTGTVSRVPGKSYTIEMTGSVGGDVLGRDRKLKVTLEPPLSFSFALFSDTSIELKNNDTIDGDVWANESVLVAQNDVLKGSVTSAGSWIRMEGGSRVDLDVWSGGSNTSDGTAIKLHNNAQIVGSAKASVSDPSTTCPDSSYDVDLGSGAVVSGDLTSCGSQTGAGSVNGTAQTGTYTEAGVPKSLPRFNFNANNYDPGTYHEFFSVADFNAWLDTNKTDLHGTFWIDEPSPSQTNRIDLTGAVVTGDVTIVTNAPVFTNAISDDISSRQVFVLVSRYEPPTGSSCDVNQDSSECAVHVKNNFDSSCATAVLIYADNGPVAIKNNQKMCGSVYAESILIKNNQTLTYDARVDRIIGFGTVTYEIVRWEELDAS